MTVLYANHVKEPGGILSNFRPVSLTSADPDIFPVGGGGGGGCSHRKRTRLIIWYFDFRISMDVSLLQEKSTFPVLTMRMSPHLEPFFFLIYDCILHKCCAISNQYHFTNPISTFLPKFRGRGGGSGPPVPPLWIRPWATCSDDK